MDILFEQRPSESPFVEKIWRSQSQSAGSFISLAGIHWMMVVTTYEGKTAITVRGPETRATYAYCPEHGDADSEFFGIVFKLGTFMPHLLPGKVLDRRDAILPDATRRSFWLKGAAWQFPDYDNADTFIHRLVRQELLVCDPVVDAAVQDHLPDLSLRSIQTRFLRATGLAHSTVRQIERAHHAMSFLEQGLSILDTVEEAGYYDQPHLTRSLKRFIGQTPVQIARVSRPA